jgi:hypothetical protein
MKGTKGRTHKSPTSPFPSPFLSPNSPAHACRRRSPTKLRRLLPAGSPSPKPSRAPNRATTKSCLLSGGGVTATLQDGGRRRKTGGRTDASVAEPTASPTCCIPNLQRTLAPGLQAGVQDDDARLARCGWPLPSIHRTWAPLLVHWNLWGARLPIPVTGRLQGLRRT